MVIKIILEKLPTMKTKKMLLFLSTGLAVVFFLAGCTKERMESPPRVDAQQALIMTGDVASYFTEEEWALLQSSYEQALDVFGEENTVLPLMVQAKAWISHDPVSRENNEGNGEIDFCFSGTGEWECLCAIDFFEVQYRPGPNGFWQGEGWLKNTGEEAMLFFTSREGEELFYQREGADHMVGAIHFNGGTHEFAGARGEATRKLVLSSCSCTEGTYILYGYVILPGQVEGWAQVRLGD
jgi:hypothetical protein